LATAPNGEPIVTPPAVIGQFAVGADARGRFYCYTLPNLNPTKQWDLARFAQLGDRISGDFGYNILLAWGPGEEEKIKFIASRMTRRHWIAPPTSVHQSIALFRNISLFISCDTGPLHLCSVMGIPTVSIFGPTDPVRNGPFGTNHEVVFKKQTCSFCYKRQCPLNNECMDEVTVEDVFQAVKKSISNHVKILAD
jgi:ADP-heptose:LPS heptosyltransferase